MQGALPSRYWALRRGQDARVAGGVIAESALAIFLNGQELATLMCSPLDEDALTLGFLHNEGMIEGLDDVRLLRFNVARTAVDVFLRRVELTPPRRIVLTSGCGGGTSFQDLLRQRPPLASALATTPDTLIERMNDLHRAAELFSEVRGVHTSILAAPSEMLFSAEDIGRHNTIDKLAGKALQAGMPTRDRIMLTSGRISSEMLNKAWRMGVPLVASRTSPTSVTLELAEAWGICVVGYLRGAGMRVYTHPQRLGLPPLG